MNIGYSDLSYDDISLIKLLIGCKLAELCYNKEHSLPVNDDDFKQLTRLYKFFSNFVD